MSLPRHFERSRFSLAYLLLKSGKSDRVLEHPQTGYMPLTPRRISEKVVQLLWKNMLFNNGSMKTTNGVSVKILKAGRFNRREGPDFKNGEIFIDGKKISGDIEIHLDAREWYQHKHHISRHYDKTILHVFLSRSEKTAPAANRKGEILHELELGLYLRHSLDELEKEIELGDSPVTGRADNPPCRKEFIKKNETDTAIILDIISEGRMLIKSNRFIDRMESAGTRQVFYEAMFECMGYSRFKREFLTVAENIPIEYLDEIISKNSKLEASVTAQAVFFVSTGLLESAQSTSEDIRLKEMLAEYGKVNISTRVANLFSLSDWSMLGCRPVNYPHRRLGAFSHIATECCDIDFFRKILLSSLAPRSKVAKMMRLFTDVSDRFWDVRYNFNRATRLPKKLIGRDRSISLMVDCVVPFFLALCRAEHDREMEKNLYEAYYIVPKPSSNSIIDFMVRNLLGKERRYLIDTVRHQQGIIQLYNDFCYKAPAGCGQCPLPEYIKDF